MTDDPIEAWAEHLGDRWRAAMRPLLEAHLAELPFPEDIAAHHGFDLHPERPFAAERRDGGWLPLRDFGCGEYDVLVVTGPEAGNVWTLTDAGAMPGDASLDREPLPWVHVDIEPADVRKAYDVRVHTFPEGRHRHVRTTEHAAVPAKRLGALLG